MVRSELQLDSLRREVVGADVYAGIVEDDVDS